MRLAVDSRSSTKRNSIMFDESGAIPIKVSIIKSMISEGISQYNYVHCTVEKN